MYLYQEKDKGNWMFRFQFNGETHSKSTKTNDKRLAEKVATAYRDNLVRKQYEPNPNVPTDGRKRITLHDAIALYMRAKAHLVSHGTQKSHRGFIESVVDMQMDMTELSTEKVEEILDARKARSAMATVLHTRNFLCGTWKHIKRLKYAVQDIDWPPISVDNKRVRYLSKEEEAKYMESLSPERKWKKMGELQPYQKDGMQRCEDLGIALLDTGARVAELVYLKKSQVNMQTREIDLRRNKTKTMTLIGITDRLCKILERRMKSPGEYVFGKLDGQPCKSAGVRVRKAIKRAGIVDFRVHDSRHDHATKLIRNGLTLHEVQNQLGHSRPETTARYAHLSKQDTARKAADTMNRITK